MKYWLIIGLLVTSAIAVSISSPDEWEVSGNTSISVNIYGGHKGDLVLANWTNEKLNIFPGHYTLEEPNAVLSFHIIPELGACGHTNLTIKVGSESRKTVLDLGQCVILPGKARPLMTPLESKMYDLNPDIDRTKEYLQLDDELQEKIDHINSEISKTLAETDFVKKDIMAHKTEALIADLSRSFPGINVLSEELSPPGNTYLLGNINQAFGNVEVVSKALWYKKTLHLQVSSVGKGTRDFTMFVVRFYNPYNSALTFKFAEDIQAQRSNIEPSLNSSITVWDLSIPPKGLLTLKYGVYDDIRRPISSLAFRVIQAPKEPISEVNHTISENKTTKVIVQVNKTEKPEPVNMSVQVNHTSGGNKTEAKSMNILSMVRAKNLPVNRTSISFTENFMLLIKRIVGQ